MAIWLNDYMSDNYIQFSDLIAYKLASELSDQIWFSKRTLGIQWVNATDSIAANIAEGFGRYHKKDKQKFYYNARGSVLEALHWTKKALERKLISDPQSTLISKKLANLPREINYQIKVTEEKLRL
jgi:four helix bundle protein